MAIPISFEAGPRDARAALRVRLEHVQDDHAEAVIAAYDLLQALHDRGVLDLVRSALAASSEILDAVVDDVNTPEAIRGLRNLLLLGGALGRIEPESFRGLVEAVPDALAEAFTKQHEPAPLWRLVRRLRSKDSRRGIAAVTDLIEILGRHLRSMESTGEEGRESAGQGVNRDA